MVVESESNLARSFVAYRRHMESPTERVFGMEFEGLEADQFAAAVRDPRSAILELTSGDNGRLSIPLAVPIEYMPWVNEPYLHRAMTRRGGTNPEIYYYNHFPHMFSQQPEAYVSALSPVLYRVADGAGAIATDHLHLNTLTTNQDVIDIAQRLGLKQSDVLGRKKPPARHYQYASPMIFTDSQRVGQTSANLILGYQAAIRNGILDDAAPITVRESLPPADIETVWPYYRDAFDKLDEIDPVKAGFSEDQFIAVMESPAFIKIVHRVGQNIANMCLLADVRSCSWLNQAYYAAEFPEAYENGRVVASPGVIADPAAGSKLSLGTMGMVRTLVELADIEPVITFVCDDESNKQVPRLSHLALNHSDQLITDFQFPTAYQLFRLFQFEAADSGRR